MFLYVLLFFVILLTFLYFIVSSNHNFFQERGVPQTKPLFFYGDYKDVVLGKKQNGIVTKEIYDFITNNQLKIIKSATIDAMEHRRLPGQRGQDLISHLMTLKEKNSTEIITEDFIIGQVWSFYLDGFETSSTVIMYVLFELGLNIDIQEQLRREIDESCERNDGKIIYDDLAGLKYLDMVVSETLRIHTPILTMERVCTQPYTFPPATAESKPLNLIPGMVVVIPIYGLHMDEKYFPQPEKFNPENFSTEAIAARPKCVHLPFGDGPRICLGSRLGLAQVKMSIASIVRNFELRTPSSTAHLGQSYNPSSFIKKPCKNIKIGFHKRKFDT